MKATAAEKKAALRRVYCAFAAIADKEAGSKAKAAQQAAEAAAQYYIKLQDEYININFYNCAKNCEARAAEEAEAAKDYFNMYLQQRAKAANKVNELYNILFE